MFKVWVVILYYFVGNLVRIPTAKEFLKSIKIWLSFHQSSAANFKGAVFFGPRGICAEHSTLEYKDYFLAYETKLRRTVSKHNIT